MTQKRNNILLIVNSLTSLVLLCLLSYLIITVTGLKTERFVYLNKSESMLVTDENGEMEVYFERGFNFIPKGSTYSIWKKFLNIECTNK